MATEGFDSVYEEGYGYYGMEGFANVFHILDPWAQELSGGRALDIGCGDGRVSIGLAGRGFDVEAVDDSPVAIEKLRTTASENELSIHARVGDVTGITIEQQSYDLIVAVTILDHIRQKEAATLARKIEQGVRAGGFIFVQVFLDDDPGLLPEQPGLVPSPTADYVHNYYPKEPHGGSLLDVFAGSGEVVSYSEAQWHDTSHGEPHHHSTATLVMQKGPSRGWQERLF